MKRMHIERYVPAAPPALDDGFPPVPCLPPRDGQIPIKFLGRPSHIDAWGSETVIAFARQYGRTCVADLDIEVAALTAERDVLMARLDELQG